VDGKPEILSFKFEKKHNPNLTYDEVGVISGDTIEVDLHNIFDVTKLVATFTYAGESVTVEGRPQKSGETVNDFQNEVIYKITGANGESREYKVLVYLLDTVSGGGQRNRRPPIPAPHTYLGEVPQTSRKILVERKPIEKMSFNPKIKSAMAQTVEVFDGKTFPHELREIDLPYKAGRLPMYSCFVPEEIELIKEGKPKTEEKLRFPYIDMVGISDDWGYEQLFPLERTPYIQLERYWERYGAESVKTMGPNQSETVTVQTTVGVTEETT
jgi:hypothetical protein